VRSMLSRSVLRHAGWRPVHHPQCTALRCAGWCSTTSALTGAQGACRRAWHGRLERRGCRSTPRRMRAAEAARQAAGIAAAKAPALCFAFARVLRQLRLSEPPNFTSLFLYRRLAAAYSCIIVGVVKELREGAVRIPVSLAPSRGGVLQLRGDLVHGANPRRVFFSSE